MYRSNCLACEMKKDATLKFHLVDMGWASEIGWYWLSFPNLVPIMRLVSSQVTKIIGRQTSSSTLPFNYYLHNDISWRWVISINKPHN